jgi:soluble lytic murein transglycosylase
VRARSVLPTLVVALACSRHPRQVQNPQENPVDAAAPVAEAASEVVLATVDAGPDAPLRELVAKGEWKNALLALRALSQAERAKPELLYLEARLCFELGLPSEVNKPLENLETKQPLLAESVRELRARAALETGDNAVAAAYFSKKDDVRSLLRAAQAFAAQKDAANTSRIVAVILARKGVSRADEALARTQRLRVGGEDGAADARWLYLRAPASEGGKLAHTQLGKTPDFSPSEWLQYAHSLVDAGRADEALLVAPRITAKVSACPRGELLGKARSYLDASKAYAQCVAEGHGDRGALALESARALSRAHKDDEARIAYEQVEKRYPEIAPKARFLRGRLFALSGKFAEAAQVLDHSDGKESDGERLRVRAIAHLLAKDPRTAKKLFTQLAGEGTEEERARASNLAALAALELGEKLAAVALWSANARARPLDYSGLVAQSRLQMVGVNADVPLGKPLPEVGTPLPAFVETLRELGLGDEAEVALRKREGEISGRGEGRTTEMLCNAYGMLDRAERRFELHTQVPKPLLELLAPEATWAWRCAYPRPYAALVKSTSALANVLPELVYGVMRAESGFRPRVHSPVNAVGLLQLMPKTAEEVAKRRGEVLPAHWMDDAFANVRLGTDYLGTLLADLKEPALAVAAYNAGPEAIHRWQNGMGAGVPLDLFIELIPYEETRVYVARVLSNFAHYMFLASETVPTLKLK